MARRSTAANGTARRWQDRTGGRSWAAGPAWSGTAADVDTDVAVRKRLQLPRLPLPRLPLPQGRGSGWQQSM